jgi:hypothetical protein
MQPRRASRGNGVAPWGLRTVLLIAVVASCPGCVTQQVIDHWRARDRVDAIGFELGEGQRVRWSVFGDDARRDGGFVLAPAPPGCDRDTVHVIGRGGLDLVSPGRLAYSLLTPRRVARMLGELAPSPCQTIISLETIGAGHDPRFVVQRGRGRRGVLEVAPPGRRAMGLLFPLAIVADTVIVVGRGALEGIMKAPFAMLP